MMQDPAAPPNAPTVLVVEDDELQRMNLVDLLRERGLTVVEASSAADALKQLEFNADVRLLFTDIQLTGEIDGLDLLRLVNVRWPHIMLLTTSGQIKPHFAELPPNATFLQKPLQTSEILKHMDELLAAAS